MTKISFSPENFRQFFPFYSKNTGVAYLDNAATSLKPYILTKSLNDFYAGAGSVHRSQYDDKNTQDYENARSLVQQWVTAESSQSVIWTSGATHSINIVAHGTSLNKEDEIITTIAEHHANFVPWQQLAHRTNAKIHYIPCNKDGIIEEDSLIKALNSRTKMVALNWVSNITGTEQPLEHLIPLIRQHSTAKILIDAAQATSLFPIDLQKLDADFLVFSAHKMFGPTGLGVLVGKEKSLNELEPLFYGGKMVQSVTQEKITFAPLPYRLEAGTPNIADVIAFGEVLKWLQTQPMKAGFQHAKDLCEKAKQRLKNYPVNIYSAPQSTVLSFSVKNATTADLAMIFAQENIALRSGKHCAMPYLQQLGEESLIRLSFAPYNNEEDLEIFFNALDNALELLC